jgi:hypothetical protein
MTGDDVAQINRVNNCLSKAFEVKDQGQLRYFLGIQVARLKKGIVLS